MAVDEGGHLGVPEAGLVSEMDARFQHVAHGNRHETLRRLGLESRRLITSAGLFAQERGGTAGGDTFRIERVREWEDRKDREAR
jgi:hypothetical protein